MLNNMYGIEWFSAYRLTKLYQINQIKNLKVDQRWIATKYERQQLNMEKDVKLFAMLRTLLPLCSAAHSTCYP